MSDHTARFALPLLYPGQAQKETTHNEALLAVELLLHPQVEAVGTNQPPSNPAPGQCWIVGSAPGGEWSGQAATLAAWTEAGWRFLAPQDGMVAWSRSDALPVRRTAGEWRLGDVHASAVLVDGVPVLGARQPAIATPDGGTVIDGEARAALTQVIETLRQHGLVARNAE